MTIEQIEVDTSKIKFHLPPITYEINATEIVLAVDKRAYYTALPARITRVTNESNRLLKYI